MNNEYTPLAEAIVELQQFCEVGCSGTFLLTTDHQHIAQFNLKDGKIIHISYNGKCGTEALSHLKKINYVKTRFLSHARTAVNSSSLSNEIIFRILLADSTSEPATNKANQGIVAVEPVHAADSNTNLQKTLSAATKKLIESALARAIGPLASIVCNELWETQPDLDSALQVILTHLPNTTKTAQFLNEISAILGDGNDSGDLLKLQHKVTQNTAAPNKADQNIAYNTKATTSSEQLSQRVKTVLERTMSEFMGPAAVLVCADHLRKAADPETAIQALAQEINNSKLAQHFIQRAHERLAVVM